MAGYFRKLVGRVYDGSHVAAENLTNGTFVIVDSDGTVTKNANFVNDVELVCVEKTELWGMPALVVDVLVSNGAGVYMVENDFPVEENGEYDETAFVVKAGEFVKIKMPLPGEQIIVSVDEETYSAVELGQGLYIDGATIKQRTAE